MRYILILLLVFLSLNAEDKKQKITIGIGPYIQTQPYKGVDDIVLPSPVIFFDNGILYIRWTRAGVYFLGEKNDDYSWGFSLSVQPRPYGYVSKDSTTLEGMSERKNTWEGGLAFSTQIDDAYLEIMILTDLLHKRDSWIAKAELGYEFKLGDFSFYPSILFIYQSSEFINYYYGVKEEEKTSFRAAYTPGSGVDFAAQTYINYPLTKNLATLINIRADLLSSKVTDSPIVDDKYIYSGLLSLIYTFEY